MINGGLVQGQMWSGTRLNSLLREDKIYLHEKLKKKELHMSVKFTLIVT